MPSPSLREIEQAVVTLFLDRPSRERFLDKTRPSKKRPTAIDSLSPELIEMVESRGVRIYSRLLRIGHHDVTDSVYPGCARLIGDKWDDVVDDYLRRFPPQHYNFNRTASRLSEYLEKYGERYTRRYPYLIELADYEWLELEIMERDVAVIDRTFEPLTTPAQFEEYAPRLNPALALRRYRFPIPEIVDYLRDECCLPRDIGPKATTVAVYRDPESHLCRFLELGALTARVVEQAATTTAYRDLLGLVVEQAADKDPQAAVVEFLELVDKLQSLKLFLGSQALREGPPVR